MSMAFEKQPGESEKAFAAFAEYLNLGPERSLELVGRKLGKSKVQMERWSSRWQWGDRVDAHARHLAIIEREATDALVRGKSAVWFSRQEEQRGEEVRLRNELSVAGRATPAPCRGPARGR